MKRFPESSLSLSLITGPLLVLLGCDPNVVIGAKLRPTESDGAPGIAGTSSGASSSGGTEEPGGGTGGSAGTGGSESGGAGGIVAAAGAAGAGGDGGEPGEIFFEADHEDGTGSLDQWNEGADADAGGYYGDAALPAFSTDRAHSGEGSAKVTIDTGAGTDQISRLYRRIETDAAYYSAWFYLNEDHAPTRWWSIFLFRAVKDRAKSIDLWSVDLVREGDSELTLSVFRHADNQSIEVPSKPIVPVGRWFQLEAYLKATPGEPSQLGLWLDGEQLLSLDHETPAPEGQPLYWVIGNGASPFAPAVSTVYVDDALVSATRRGP